MLLINTDKYMCFENIKIPNDIKYYIMYLNYIVFEKTYKNYKKINYELYVFVYVSKM